MIKISNKLYKMKTSSEIRLSTLFCLFFAVSGNIYDKLSYFEVINGEDSLSRNRRSIYGSQHEDDEEFIQEYSLTAFNRTFDLVLKPRTEVFSPHFKLTVVHADGSENLVPFQEGNFYSGTVKGEENSDVHGYFEDGSFVGTISIDGQLFVIEPAWRHINDRHHGIDSGKMVIYRGSDVKWPGNERDGKKFCKFVRANGEEASDDPRQQSSPMTTNPKRKKRATPTKNTCDIYAVADYKFFKSIGRSDIYRTASYIVGVIERTDAIYRQTNWGDLSKMGLEIGQIRIFTSFTDSVSSHFNQNKTVWGTVDLLKNFGQDLTLKDYCLGHLFTHERFIDNVLGLAYIASSRSGSAGGICSPTRVSDGFETCFNTAWTSTSSTNGDTVLIQQSDLVTAHEIGHNWGSEHDSGDCAPSSFFGNGKYLMYPFSVAGFDSNNYLFSSCSKQRINQVLTAKSDSCFQEPTPVTECGNGMLNIDNSEECDAGFLGRYGQDQCCNSRCRLKPPAVCSPNNHECCLNCQRSPVGTICRNDTFSTCKKISYCSGNSLDCPAPENADDNTACIDDGVCRGGVCLGICQLQGLSPCVCEEVATSCSRCCRNTTTSTCFESTPITALPDGRPCVQGYCISGSCKKAAQSLVERLFSFIENITFSVILIFFKDNIVGCIMVFTLVLWIPISCCISYKDRQREKRFRHEFDIEPRTDRMFVFDEDKRRVKVPDQHRKPRTPKEIFVAQSKKRY